MQRLSRSPRSRESGSTAVEYALIASAMAIFVIAILIKVGGVLMEYYVESCSATQLDMNTTTTCIKRNG